MRYIQQRVEFCIVLGSEQDSQSWAKLPLNEAPESSIYMDAGYTNYLNEDDLFEAELVQAKVDRRRNSKRKDEQHTSVSKNNLCVNK